ncbi:hypothetical protein ACQKWADRAFT_327403 [Trichoderma austrokoningii]
MSASRPKLSKVVIVARDGCPQDRKDSSKGETFEESSKREPWLKLMRMDREARGAARNLILRCREAFSEGSEGPAVEMQPMGPYEGDGKKSHGKGKNLADKGKKAVYRDPWVVHKHRSAVEKQRPARKPKGYDGGNSGLSSALAKLRLDHDEYQQELTQEQQLELEWELEQIRMHDPCNEAEDGWMVVKEDLDVWDFTEEVGRVLPD